MPTLGGIAINDNGAVALNDSGAVKICDCCDCTPYTLASFTTNPSNPDWDLTPYQGPGIAEPGRPWRLIEVGFPLQYNTGCVDADGVLVGLPSNFHSNFGYNGYMQIQIGCIETSTYSWPTGADTVKWGC